MDRRCLLFSDPGVITIVDDSATILTSALGPLELEVATLFTAVSPGTELLVFKGLMPKGLSLDATIKGMQDEFAYPTKYGYCNVGVVVAVGERLVPDDWIQQRVFAFQPHQGSFRIPVDQVIRIPEQVSTKDALFFPNVETAVNLVMDAAPLIGESVAIVGQGIIGILTAAVLRKWHPSVKIAVVDICENRLTSSCNFAPGIVAFNPKNQDFIKNLIQFCSAGQDNNAGADIAIDISSSGSGLNTAIECCRNYGKVVIGSWYGSKDVSLSCLGGKFHRSHITLVASQVSEIPMSIAGRWTKSRRSTLVWQILPQLEPSHLISHICDVSDAQNVYEQLIDKPELIIQPVFTYHNDLSIFGKQFS